MATYENRAEQAAAGLGVMAEGGIVLVSDGADRWLCEEAAYDRAISELAAQAPIRARAGDGDTGECDAEAYQQLCDLARRYTSDLASLIGSGKGDRSRIVCRANEAGLLDAADARAYGVTL